VAGVCRKLHNEELHNFSPRQMLLDQVKDDEIVLRVAVMREKRNACRVMVEKSEGRRLVGRQNVGGRIVLKSKILEK
jgi:hypothetical protein